MPLVDLNVEEKLAEKDKELFNLQIKTMNDGIARIEFLLNEVKRNSEKEYDRMQKEINSVRVECEKKIAVVSEKQEIQKDDYIKFKTKVLTWAAAGSLVGGVIMKLLFK